MCVCVVYGYVCVCVEGAVCVEVCCGAVCGAVCVEVHVVGLYVSRCV